MESIETQFEEILVTDAEDAGEPGIAETQQVIDFRAARNIKANIELLRPDQLNRAFERVVNKDIRFRFVIDFASAKGSGRMTPFESVAGDFDQARRLVAAAELLVSCEQPYVSSVTLRSLCNEQRRARSGVVASRYCQSDGTLGVHALFTSQRFAALTRLSGPLGASQLIASESSPAFIDCPEAIPDVDTPADMLATHSRPQGKTSQ